MRPVTILVVGLVASGTTALLVYRAVQTRVVVQNAPAAQATDLQIRPVVVAAADVPFGSTLGEEQLKVVDWPANALPPNNFAARENVVGRMAMTRLVVNEPITTEKLVPTGSKGLLPLVIEHGMRAVTVKVNEVAAVGGFIAAGSRVDVLVTAERKAVQGPSGVVGMPQDMQTQAERNTRTLLQDVTVLALGQLLDASGQPKPGDALTTATLLVNPEQGELLALGSIEGTLQLVLRNFEDHTIVASGGKRAQDLFLNHTRLASADSNTVEMILGGQRFSLTF